MRNIERRLSEIERQLQPPEPPDLDYSRLTDAELELLIVLLETHFGHRPGTLTAEQYQWLEDIAAKCEPAGSVT